MTIYSSKKQVQDELRAARLDLKSARKNSGAGSQAAAAALKKCNDLQYILDTWDAHHS